MQSGYHFIEEIRLNKMPPKSSYISRLPAVKNLAASEGLSFNSDITFIVGENGSGKSTLLEAIAVAAGFNPEGGFFLRAESFYNAASYVEEIDAIPAPLPKVIEGYGGVSLHEQSHGESFLAVIKNRFFGNGLYILDEPEAALSPTGIMSLMVIIHDLLDKNSQFIISTHSPILITYPNALIYELDDDKIRPVTYRETGHYAITKRFLDDPEKMLDQLFK